MSTSKKVQTLASKIVAANLQIRDIDTGVETILRSHYGADRWEQIKAARAKAVKEVEALEKQIKEAARDEAVTGENRVLVENEAIKISVSGTKPKVTYDPETILENCPEDLVDKVMVYDVDTKRLDACIQLGLPAEVLATIAAARREEPQTPKVLVKFIEPEAGSVAPSSDVAPVLHLRRTGS